VTNCRHTPSLLHKALYWAHVIWNHTPQFEYLAGKDSIIRVCLIADWIDGLLDRCPSCLWDSLDTDFVHLHHVMDEHCD